MGLIGLLWGAYGTKEEVMEWMLDIQLGRRNLSPIQRIKITEKYRPIYEKQVRENLIKAGGDKNRLRQVYHKRLRIQKNV